MKRPQGVLESTSITLNGDYVFQDAIDVVVKYLKMNDLGRVSQVCM